MAPHIHITVEKKELLKNFPGGSAIEFFGEHFYLIGDDARNILILDRDYNAADNILLFSGESKRIEKKIKTDFESSAIITFNDSKHLLVLGSASAAIRERAFLFPLPANGNSQFTSFDTHEFTNRLKQMGMAEVNMEGATAAGNQLLISNRANKTYPHNLLIVTSTNFFEKQLQAPVHVLKLALPELEFPIGISELYYVAASDRLFFTGSIERTTNTYDDGGIGDSYLGYINNISTHLQGSIVCPDALLNLSATNDIFKGEKVEAICFEDVLKNKIIAHLMSDNDNGQSTLFKVILVLQ